MGADASVRRTPDAAGARAVAGPTLTRQRGHPVGPGVACGGCPNNAAQLIGQAHGRRRHVVRQIEEMAQIGDEHRQTVSGQGIAHRGLLGRAGAAHRRADPPNSQIEAADQCERPPGRDLVMT
jgi:hypothetical protein